MLDRLDKEFAFGREALDVRAYRQELLSSNIANADTPGYKARDVDFSSALAGALKQGGGAPNAATNGSTLKMAQPVSVSMSGGLAATAKGHMSGSSTLSASGGSSDDYGRLAYRVPNQPSLDGNTVDLDAERVQFADNALHFEAGMTVLSSQIKSMLSAITSNS
ncbi:flagellar basal-body rod protein FlgB [Caballeronia fortuita]|uniref:Flagellar basal body rod protein FlgB n=1 Tax=Caballeronia fortuita TaxID=1777138 RepID=A0A157Z1Z0_9BURK|nr:flagellar basal body rod protein FlgB [Caballeronia fortuita]SAK39514.1 flagellar basal-body rod protein FlgB [Caballeronia fortuita]